MRPADLDHAIHHNNLQAVQKAVCRGARLERAEHPPLQSAVAAGNVDMVRLLISAGAPPLSLSQRQSVQAVVELALNSPECPEFADACRGDGFLDCLEEVDALALATATTVRQRRRAFVLRHFHDPSHRVTHLHRIVRATTGQKVSLPTITSDLKRLGLR